MNTQLSLSIALTTYNGEHYIREQLDSLVCQTRLPDELIISDDASVDSTLDIIKDFKHSSPFPVKLQINQECLGSTRNFESAIRACSGDIIFLCDQDDIWYPDKIARIEECFVNNTEAGAVFTDADIVNQDLQLYGPKLWKKNRFSSREQEQLNEGDAFTVLLKHSVVTGATMAFRSSYRDFLIPIPDIWVHDAWIAFLISASSSLISIPTPLIAYRQHSSNQIGVAGGGKNLNKTCAEYHGHRVLCYELMRARMIKFIDRFPDVMYKIYCLDRKIDFLRARTALPDTRLHRMPGALRELAALHYYRYTKAGIGSFFNDLLRGG
jgi:glycosyltransferase involved in cell wall biosynthesis